MASCWRETILVVMNVWNFAFGLCPELFQRYSASHTFCLPANSSCKIVANTVTEAHAQAIVSLHNRYRSRVATGQEAIGRLPSATDMLEMEWSEELAVVAQKHANQCKYAHDCNECRETKNFEAGQNIYLHWISASVSPRLSWEEAVEAWYEEVRNFDRGIIASYNNAKASGPIGHFTQLIWSRTWKVGCGYVAYRNRGTTYEMYTCNYGPTGNVLGEPVYKKGPACSSCPGDTCCGASCPGRRSYPGLCQILPGRRPEYVHDIRQYSYYCDFGDASNCHITTPPGMKQWQVTRTLSGNRLGIVLRGGESSQFNVTPVFRSSSASCLTMAYKKGPNVAARPGRNRAEERFLLANSNFHRQVAQPLADSRVYMTFAMDVDFGQDFKLAVSFHVPPGSSAQYFEVKEIYSKAGHCHH